MATLFTKIIAGEIPATFVWKDTECVAFMSINPLRAGHTLVVSRMEIDHWIDCPDELRDHVFSVAQRIARAQYQAYRPEKVGLMIAGLEVPHLHIHVVPMDGVQDLDFANAAASVERDELEDQAGLLRHALRSMGVDEASD